MKRLRAWLALRQAAARNKREEDGFGWAMTAHYRNGMSVEEIEGYGDIARIFGEHDSFDVGVEAALRMIGELTDSLRFARSTLHPQEPGLW